MRLVVHPEMQIAFLETEVRQGSSTTQAPSFVEYRVGLAGTQWSISAAQAALLPGHWANIVGGLGSAGSALKRLPATYHVDLIGIPWRAALAVQADGWWLAIPIP